MNPTGLCGALQMDLWVCVSPPKNTGALGSQMSAEQSHCTITSGHLGPINTARRLQPVVFFFLWSPVVSSSLFSVLRLFLPLPPSQCLYITLLFTLLFSIASCMHTFLAIPSCTAPTPEHIHFFFNRLPLLPPLHLKFHLFFLHTQLVANSVSCPPSSSNSCHLRTALLSLVTLLDSLTKRHVLPERQQQQSEFAIQIGERTYCKVIQETIMQIILPDTQRILNFSF